jgi:hypothetical protein
MAQDFVVLEYEDLRSWKVVNCMIPIRVIIKRLQRSEMIEVDCVEGHFGNGELGFMNSSMGLNTQEATPRPQSQ